MVPFAACADATVTKSDAASASNAPLRTPTMAFLQRFAGAGRSIEGQNIEQLLGITAVVLNDQLAAAGAAVLTIDR
jgi:hypothetical protein